MPLTFTEWKKRVSHFFATYNKFLIGRNVLNALHSSVLQMANIPWPSLTLKCIESQQHILIEHIFFTAPCQCHVFMTSFAFLMASSCKTWNNVIWSLFWHEIKDNIFMLLLSKSNFFFITQVQTQKCLSSNVSSAS